MPVRRLNLVSRGWDRLGFASLLAFPDRIEPWFCEGGVWSLPTSSGPPGSESGNPDALPLRSRGSGGLGFGRLGRLGASLVRFRSGWLGLGRPGSENASWGAAVDVRVGRGVAWRYDTGRSGGGAHCLDADRPSGEHDPVGDRARHQPSHSVPKGARLEVASGTRSAAPSERKGTEWQINRP